MTQLARARAQALADELRPQGVPVEPIVVASVLGVRVERRRMAWAVLGATPSPSRIVINDELVGRRERFVVAHELAHILVKRGRVSFSDHLVEEVFADMFAHALLVPEAGLADTADIDGTAAQLDADAVLGAHRAAGLRRSIKARAA